MATAGESSDRYAFGHRCPPCRDIDDAGICRQCGAAHTVPVRAPRPVAGDDWEADARHTWGTLRPDRLHRDDRIVRLFAMLDAERAAHAETERRLAERVDMCGKMTGAAEAALRREAEYRAERDDLDVQLRNVRGHLDTMIRTHDEVERRAEAAEAALGALRAAVGELPSTRMLGPARDGETIAASLSAVQRLQALALDGAGDAGKGLDVDGGAAPKGGGGP